MGDDSYLLTAANLVSVPCSCGACWQRLALYTSLQSNLITGMIQDPDSCFTRVTFWECVKCGQHYTTVASVNNLRHKDLLSGVTRSSVKQGAITSVKSMQEMLRDISLHG
jgi:hypothetical protein